ncbi:MAG: SIMPL domain-containing protein [Flavobacteriales bacterium]|nr:SIMPL domain-containing protein [Flavobacteriales bacterium]
MYSKFCLVFFMFLYSGIAFAQASGNILYNENQRWLLQNQTFFDKAFFNNQNEVLLEVNAMYNVKADSYLAIFNLIQIGNTARETDSLMNERINRFKRDVVKVGVREDDFVIDMLSLVPVYEIETTRKLFSKTFTEIPAGFEMQKNIHIHFRDEQVLDEIITAAAINEIYDLVKVDYYVKNMEHIYDSLRTEATKMVEKRVAQYKKLGVAMDGQWTLATDKIGVFFPLDRYTAYQASSSISIDAAKKKAQPTQIRRPSTVYYNKIPYNGYDIIFNPEIIEPSVQYTYNLQVKFTLE